LAIQLPNSSSSADSLLGIAIMDYDEDYESSNDNTDGSSEEEIV